MSSKFAGFGLVGVLTSLAFWSNAQQDETAKGKQVYEQSRCVVCHGKDGKAPFDLTTKLNDLGDNEVKEFIKDPAAFGNRQMPAFGPTLSDPEIDAVIAYVRSLSKAGKKRSK